MQYAEQTMQQDTKARLGLGSRNNTLWKHIVHQFLQDSRESHTDGGERGCYWLNVDLHHVESSV